MWTRSGLESGFDVKTDVEMNTAFYDSIYNSHETYSSMYLFNYLHIQFADE